jgi:peptidyl-prolyl cis-trans isomerase SurA
MRNSVAALVVAGSLVGAAAGVRAEVIDRILAVVNGALILQSDVAVAIRLGLVPSAGAPDPASAALDSLIERQLMLSEVDRYTPPDPAEADVDRHVADIRSRAGAQFDAILLQGGIAVDQLRREVRDNLRIEAYLQQRFGAIQPTEEEILQYYRDHPAAFAQNGVVRSFDDAHDVARAALIEERRSATIRDWVAGLRRRANVSVLPR